MQQFCVLDSPFRLFLPTPVETSFHGCNEPAFLRHWYGLVLAVGEYSYSEAARVIPETNEEVELKSSSPLFSLCRRVYPHTHECLLNPLFLTGTPGTPPPRDFSPRIDIRSTPPHPVGSRHATHIHLCARPLHLLTHHFS